MASSTAGAAIAPSKPSLWPFSAASRLLVPFPKPLLSLSPSHRNVRPISASADRHQTPSAAASTASTTAVHLLRNFAPDEPRKGSDILVEALEREGVTDLFAYPGGASMEIHQALTRSPSIINHLLRHEQGEIFAASGYARSTGRPGVCIATSGPGATNLVSGFADALLDSVPLVAITGQVPRRMIGTDAFQETPIVEVTRSITKHNYLVLNVDDIPRIIKEAFFLASTGRPGPVLVDIPKDIQQQLAIPVWDPPLRLPGYISRLPKPPSRCLLDQIIRLVSESHRPVLYVGGGCLNSSEELRRAKIVHIDIDPAEIGKNKQPHVSLCADVRLALQGMNALMEESGIHQKFDFSTWRKELDQLKKTYPLSYKTFGDLIPPQYAIQVLDELTNGEAIISTGVGQHQMWAAQCYSYKRARQWLTSGGLGAMGFGLPAAAGAAVGNPGVTVVDIDGDGSFQMNAQELAMIRIENLPVKMMVLNNQHLGMVVQWEDRFYRSNRGHTYLGNPANESEIFPDFLKITEAYGIPAARVTKKSEVREAIRKMLKTPGPYLLDVIVPHEEHVLPMIPSGGAFKDMILDGDGRTPH
ncbi:hypothetical protein C4D60_Mb10t17940 [Musa balbisiana]|uniref:Acetolactate synthase n=1 Tax=Musa balbisiana TaxID=52838 RepID=A0A4S8IXY2_MUSBA|nr:hypothetical protein C4D60_Mb10t17940 [Musa balbisiana]